MERLTFLGIAGNDSVSQNALASGGIVFNYRNYQIVIDPGPGTLVKCREFGINPSATNIILASHNHIAHCNDINLFIDAMSYHGLDQKGILIADESVIHGTNSERPAISRTHKPFIEKEIVLKESEDIDLPSIKIQGLKTEHSCFTALGFKIITDEVTITYSGDTKYFDELPSLYRNTDILILNVPYPRKIFSDTNLNVQDAINIINTVKPKLAIITHFNKQMLKESPIYYSREIQRETNTQVLAAKEGLSFDPLPYAKLTRQKGFW